MRQQSAWMCVCRVSVLPSVIIGVVFGCLLLSFSRGAWIACLAQFAIVGVLWLFLDRSIASFRNMMVAVIVMSLTAVSVYAGVNHLRSQHYPLESAMKKITLQSDEGTSSIDERSQFFQQAMIFTKQRPILGYGPYSFRFVAPHLQVGILATSDHPHNVFLKLSMERGVVAAGLFGLIVLIALASGAQYFVRRKRTMLRFDDFYVLALMTSVLGVILHNLIDYNLQFVGIALPLWIMLGFLVASNERSMESEQILRSTGVTLIKHYLRWATLVIAVSLTVVVIIEGTFLFLSHQARKAENLGRYQEALHYYALTDHSFFQRDAWLSRSVIDLHADRVTNANVAVMNYISSNELDARGWRLLGDVLLRQDRRKEAIAAYEKAFSYGGKNDAGILRGLVDILMLDPARLTRRRHDIDALLNDFAFAIRYNTHFIALSSNVEQVISVAKTLRETFPSEKLQYSALIDDVLENSTKERARSKSRPRGYLW